MFKITRSFFKKLFLLLGFSFLWLFALFSSSKQNASAKIDPRSIVTSLRNSLGLKRREIRKKNKNQISKEDQQKEENKIELIEYRTETAKTYQLDENTFQIVASLYPVHFKDQLGKWQDFDLDIKIGKTTKGLILASLLDNQIGYKARHRNDEGGFEISLNSIGGIKPRYTKPILEGNTATWKQVIPGMDISIHFQTHRIAIWRKIYTDQVPKKILWDVSEDLIKKKISIADDIVGFDKNHEHLQSTRIKQNEIIKRNVKNYQLADVFTGNIIQIAKTTRRKYLSAKTQYPVLIDADITITNQVVDSSGSPGAHVDGSMARFDKAAPFNWATAAYDSVLFSTGPVRVGITEYYAATPTKTGGYRFDGFVRFDGITIPKGASITTAVLKLYPNAAFPGNDPFIVRAPNENDPNLIAGAADAPRVFSPTTVAGTITKTLTGATGAYLDFNVASIVDTLTNNFNYTNESMLFFLRLKTLITPNSSKLFKFKQDTNSTSQSNLPQLVIQYTGRLQGSRIITVE